MPSFHFWRTIVPHPQPKQYFECIFPSKYALSKHVCKKQNKKITLFSLKMCIVKYNYGLLSWELHQNTQLIFVFSFTDKSESSRLATAKIKHGNFQASLPINQTKRNETKRHRSVWRTTLWGNMDKILFRQGKHSSPGNHRPALTRIHIYPANLYLWTLLLFGIIKMKSWWIHVPGTVQLCLWNCFF